MFLSCLDKPVDDLSHLCDGAGLQQSTGREFIQMSESLVSSGVKPHKRKWSAGAFSMHLAISAVYSLILANYSTFNIFMSDLLNHIFIIYFSYSAIALS